MARMLRVELDGALFHVTARGNERKPIVRDDEDRSRWLEWLARVVGRHKLELFSFALLANHYHLFLETPHGGLSRAMQTLNGSYTSYFNRRHRRAGHLFQGRFKAILVERAGHYAELSRYIHLNPVRAGVVREPESYLWSSFRGYYRARWALDWVNYDRVLSEFGSSLSQARQAYRKFVEEGLVGRIESPLRAAVHGFILGGEAFVAKIEGLVKSREDDGSMPELRALRSEPRIEVIGAAVAGSYELREDEVVRRGRGRPEARDVALYLARELTDARLKEIGEFFGAPIAPAGEFAGQRDTGETEAREVAVASSCRHSRADCIRKPKALTPNSSCRHSLDTRTHRASESTGSTPSRRSPSRTASRAQQDPAGSCPCSHTTSCGDLRQVLTQYANICTSPLFPLQAAF